jgi:hypothetical protein
MATSDSMPTDYGKFPGLHLLFVVAPPVSTAVITPCPVLEDKEGILIITNPACYVWPDANNCEPGDHFTMVQKEAAKAFANYKPYPFQIPIAQRIANWVNCLSLIAALFFLILYAARATNTYGNKENRI